MPLSTFGLADHVVGGSSLIVLHVFERTLTTVREHLCCNPRSFTDIQAEGT